MIGYRGKNLPTLNARERTELNDGSFAALQKKHADSDDEKPKRYTLSLPENVHAELTLAAEERSSTVRDIVLKCLKLGLLAMSMEEKSGAQLIIKEISSSGEVKETRLLLW